MNLRPFWQQPTARLGFLLAMLLCTASLFGQAVWRVSPAQMNLAEKLTPPSARHPLGTDQFGRDELARVLEGGRRSLGAALSVLAGVLSLSLLIGSVAGLRGGWLEVVTLRALDILLAVPTLVLALALIGVLGVGYGKLVLALTLSWTAYYARLTRSYTRLARDRQDVIAAQLAGVAQWRVITGHIAPSVIAQLAVILTLDLGQLIVALAGLSFLGLGAQPPEAEWGAMLAESRLYFTVAPWLLLAPALAILWAVTAANLLGNAWRDATGAR